MALPKQRIWTHKGEIFSEDRKDKISDLIKFLEKMKEKFGDIPIDIPQGPSDSHGNCISRENWTFDFGSISTSLYSTGEEIEW